MDDGDFYDEEFVELGETEQVYDDSLEEDFEENPEAEGFKQGYDELGDDSEELEDDYDDFYKRR